MEHLSILFLFDSGDTKTGLHNLYNELGKEHDCIHITQVEEASELIKSKKIDVVICETDINGKSGIEFQKFVFNSQSQIVRFLYSDTTDKELVYKSTKFIHQYITSDCKPNQFVSIIKNTIGLRELLNDRKLHEKLNSISSLPTPPDIYQKLMSELQKDDVSIRNVADVIKKDVSITAKILQIVNSAFFGMKTHVESPLHAVNLLGIDTVKSLVMTAGVFTQFSESSDSGFTIESIYDKSVTVGATARHLANSLGMLTKQTEEALMAGMLHDVGKLIMMQYFPEELRKSVILSKEKEIPLFEAQKEIFGISDAILGAYLLSLWGLLQSILEALPLHYPPSETPVPLTNVTTAVHLAYAFTHDLSHNINALTKSAVCQRYIEKIG
ncbi:MAG: HDOD domain-containing protein, partial [Calditrichaeota bacterium]